MKPSHLIEFMLQIKFEPISIWSMADVSRLQEVEMTFTQCIKK